MVTLAQGTPPEPQPECPAKSKTVRQMLREEEMRRGPPVIAPGSPASRHRTLRELLKGDEGFPAVLRTLKDSTDDCSYEVLRDYKIHGYCVPAGFRCDGASCWPDVDDPEGWLLHDWLYTTHGDADGGGVPKDVADSQLHEWYMRLAVKIGAQEAWESSYMNKIRLRGTAWGKGHLDKLR